MQCGVLMYKVIGFLMSPQGFLPMEGRVGPWPPAVIISFNTCNSAVMLPPFYRKGNQALREKRVHPASSGRVGTGSQHSDMEGPRLSSQSLGRHRKAP